MGLYGLAAYFGYYLLLTTSLLTKASHMIALFAVSFCSSVSCVTRVATVLRIISHARVAE